MSLTFDSLTDWFSANQAIATIFLVGGFFLLRSLSERLIRGEAGLVSEDRRRLLSNVKNGLVLLLLVGLVMTWAPALRTFALSITAFLVALIIATKELILCVTGGLLRAGSGAFSVGDWIRVGDTRGEVIDQSLLTVTVQELEPPARGHAFTGRTITVPNSVFLTMLVVNERFYKYFVYHSIEVTLERADDGPAVARLMRETAERLTAPHREKAQRYNALIERRSGYDMPQVGPRFRWSTTNEGRPRVAMTLFVPTGQVEEIEREVVTAVLARLRQETLARAAVAGTGTGRADAARSSP